MSTPSTAKQSPLPPLSPSDDNPAQTPTDGSTSTKQDQTEQPTKEKVSSRKDDEDRSPVRAKSNRAENRPKMSKSAYEDEGDRGLAATFTQVLNFVRVSKETTKRALDEAQEEFYRVDEMKTKLERSIEEEQCFLLRQISICVEAKEKGKYSEIESKTVPAFVAATREQINAMIGNWGENLQANSKKFSDVLATLQRSIGKRGLLEQQLEILNVMQEKLSIYTNGVTELKNYDQS